MLEQPEDELLPLALPVVYPPGDAVEDLDLVVDLQPAARHQILHALHLHLVEVGRLGHLDEVALDVLERVLLEGEGVERGGQVVVEAHAFNAQPLLPDDMVHARFLQLAHLQKHGGFQNRHQILVGYLQIT